MKKAPNWHDHNDPVDGVWKQDLLRFLGKEFNFRTLVETGTCEASTIISLQQDFDEIHSIELADFYYKIALRRTSGMKNIHLYRGNSEQLLASILRKLNAPPLFWLDAHSSGGMTANEGDPLPHEIKDIQYFTPNAMIVIDDCHSVELAQVEAAGVSLEGWERHYITGEIIMFRKGIYKLPEFEES